MGQLQQVPPRPIKLKFPSVFELIKLSMFVKILIFMVVVYHVYGKGGVIGYSMLFFAFILVNVRIKLKKHREMQL